MIRGPRVCTLPGDWKFRCALAVPLSNGASSSAASRRTARWDDRRREVRANDGEWSSAAAAASLAYRFNRTIIRLRDGTESLPRDSARRNRRARFHARDFACMPDRPAAFRESPHFLSLARSPRSPSLRERANRVSRDSPRRYWRTNNPFDRPRKRPINPFSPRLLEEKCTCDGVGKIPHFSNEVHASSENQYLPGETDKNWFFHYKW